MVPGNLLPSSGERLRLGRELHDTLLQNLVGLALQFDVLSDGVAQLVTADARYRLVRIRKLVEGLRPRGAAVGFTSCDLPPPTCPDLTGPR